MRGCGGDVLLQAGGHAWLQGVCMFWGGMCGYGGVHGCRGHVWLAGGMRGCGGACMVVGGACVVAGGACTGYNEIRSISGRYASYWNAFLFLNVFSL